MNFGPQGQLATLTFEQPDANSRSEPEGKVISALKDGDWREIARRRRARAKMYTPPGSHAGTGASGSAVGPGETLNSEPSLAGLHKRQRAQVDTTQYAPAPTEPEPPFATATEDERAIRALIADAEGGDDPEGSMMDIIPMGNRSSTRRAPTEDDAFREDIEELPNEATLKDYERMPVSQFGAALMRGMGWKPGEPASRRVVTRSGASSSPGCPSHDPRCSVSGRRSGRSSTTEVVESAARLPARIKSILHSYA